MPTDVTVSVRVTRRTHLQLRLLSATLGRPIHDLVAEAVTAHYRTEIGQLTGAVSGKAAGRSEPARRR